MIEDNENFKRIAKSFPKIAGELKSLWGTAQFNGYLESLEQDTSGVHRVGFPEEILLALLTIGNEHDAKFPNLQPKTKWIS